MKKKILSTSYFILYCSVNEHYFPQHLINCQSLYNEHIQYISKELFNWKYQCVSGVTYIYRKKVEKTKYIGVAACKRSIELESKSTHTHKRTDVYLLYWTKSFRKYCAEQIQKKKKKTFEFTDGTKY